jgi:hypothetical protein
MGDITLSGASPARYDRPLGLVGADLTLGDIEKPVPGPELELELAWERVRLYELRGELGPLLLLPLPLLLSSGAGYGAPGEPAACGWGRKASCLAEARGERVGRYCGWGGAGMERGEVRVDIVLKTF